MSIKFVHLRVHTEFSLVDGIARVKPLLQETVQQKMGSVAVTDVSNMFSLVRFYRQSYSFGVKPICGCDIWLENKDNLGCPSQLVLLCMNSNGYKNLMEIISDGFLHNQHHGKALIKMEWIFEKSEGLIVLSGGVKGSIGENLLSGDQVAATLLLKQYKEVFGNRFYLELQRTNRKDEDVYIKKVIKLAEEFNCPVVATNDVMFMEQHDFDAHEARFCIGQSRALDDPRRSKPYSDQQYFKSADEMCELFSDIPEAIENTVEIAKRCNIEVSIGETHLPDYPIPAGQTIDEYFRAISLEGLEERFLEVFQADEEELDSKKQIYYDRLDFELKIIIKMGFPGYFLIVMDFIRWSKQNNIPVGPGRGSGAGSLVAYAQKITDLDPLKYDLLFERFLNPERVSMPDFDVDFCMDNRDRVIEYVAETYGRNAVSQIVTFGTMAAKAVVKDVARVQGKSYGLADKLSKMIPFEIGMTLSKAYGQESVLRDYIEGDEEAQEIWEMALKLEGITRNVGKHAGGVVIAPTKLTDFSPLYCDEEGQGLVTQYDKDDVEAVGLVKFDFLGLRTLTIVDRTIRMVNKRLSNEVGKQLISIRDIDLEDQPSYDLLKKMKTTAVFQLESRGMKDLIKRLQPDCFEDIVALVALFRPGPLQSGMVDNFIDRKHGREQVSYPDSKYQHEWLEPILSSTYGIILYQEQVMNIAQVLAGYSLGEADVLRRAMGKKKPEEMEKQRSVFEDGAVSKGVDAELSMKIFDLVEKFSGYGFNKSHSAAYALVSYQTLWLKTHYPAEFMSAVLSSDMQNTDKVVMLLEECRHMDLEVTSPNVNSGDYMFEVNKDREIVYGLGAIKGLGRSSIESIVETRQEKGGFLDIFDFCKRLGTKKINKRGLESLVCSGALDEIGPCPGRLEDLNVNRSILNISAADAIKAADQAMKAQDNGLTDLFGEVIVDSGVDVYENYHGRTIWTDKERLMGEKGTLGLYLTGHPIEEYEEEIRYFAKDKIVNLQPGCGKIKVAGLIVSLRTMTNKRGGKMCFAFLDDRSARIEVSIFTEVFERVHHLLVKDNLVVVEGEVSLDEFSGSTRLVVQNVFSLMEMRNKLAIACCIKLKSADLKDGFENDLQRLLSENSGRIPVHIEYENYDVKAQMVLDSKWSVSLSDNFLNQLEESLNMSMRILYQLND